MSMDQVFLEGIFKDLFTGLEKLTLTIENKDLTVNIQIIFILFFRLNKYAYSPATMF